MGDLVLLDKTDIDTILGSDMTTFIKRRQVWALVQFVKVGGSLSNSIMLSDLHKEVSPCAATSRLAPDP